jgi:elongator complex protein 3
MSSINKQFIATALTKDFPSTKRFLKFKKSFYSENKLPQPTNADIRELYEKMIARKEVKRKPSFEKSMLSRGVRTQSGVAVVAVLTKPYVCPGKCAFCPSEENMPKSYLSNEPAVMRAIMNKFNPYQQVQSRLHALMINGHSTNKIELIVMGGTFSYFPKKYQYWFIKECFRACNEFELSRKSKCLPYQITKVESQKSNKKWKRQLIKEQEIKKRHSSSQKISSLQKQLLHEQKKNEKNKTKMVGLTLETRPDWINKKEIINFRELGCTRVELGVQSIYDDILKKNRRGHLAQSTIDATKLLKEAGFKINYHMMPGLYGSSPFSTTCVKGVKVRGTRTLGGFSDLQMFKELFSNPDYQPDMLKIYPTVVIKGTPLYRWWKQGNYKPLDNDTFEKLVIKIKNEAIPPYIRIQRLVRDVPLPSIEAGPTISNLRQVVAPKAHCQCIRCREIKGDYKSTPCVKGVKVRGTRTLGGFSEKTTNQKIFLNRIDYSASDGKEIFLQFIDNDNRLYALLRLRINSSSTPASAIIREVHTYGKVTAVGKKDKNSPQHIGLGRKLLQEAEKIAKEELTNLNIPKNKQKIAVISGVGVRDYYRQNGYRLQNTYMLKKLK